MRDYKKATTNNAIRDGTMKVFQRIASLAQCLQQNPNMTFKRKCIATKMKQKRPLYWYWYFLASRLSNFTNLSEIGFGIVFSPSNITQDSNSQEDQQNSLSYLEDGDKKK
mmetsp:Transcript_6205/g.9679  ORF Transcript_6205/g.9679 Transcript_6205/m.9679 type:complete len:110 (-) Transcript_6205:635-964(-)